MPNLSVQQLRQSAISNSLFPLTNLKAAISRMGFVQADPIRSPAAAQDLILRQRVKNYRAGDLERKYASLDLEEDYIYAYGFMPRATWQLLHPRDSSDLPAFEQSVLKVARQLERIHPADLEEHLGVERVINAWGGYSKATTRALEDLHYRGLLRVAGREKGIRIYEAVSAGTHDAAEQPEIRLRKLVSLLVRIFAPSPRKSLQETINKLRYAVPGALKLREILDSMLKSGEIRTDMINGISYIFPHDFAITEYGAREAKILAPFDPVVWDRRRFEHLWGWAYRFEAYTPVAKRVRGYYAMPLLWRDDVIGWVNMNLDAGRLKVTPGYAQKRPREKQFKEQLDAEVSRFKAFLTLT